MCINSNSSSAMNHILYTLVNQPNEQSSVALFNENVHPQKVDDVLNINKGKERLRLL